MNMTHRWASILLVSTMFSATAKTILLDVRPGNAGGSPTSTPADFQGYDPLVAATAPVGVTTTYAGLNNKVLMDENGASYTVTTTGSAATYNAQSASWNDTTPIVSGYCYKNDVNLNVITITGVNQFPAGQLIRLTVFGIGDNLNQGASFAPTYAGTTYPAKETTFGTVQPTETNSVRSAQFLMTSDGTTNTLSFTWTSNSLATTAAFNGFSITSSPATPGDVTSATLAPVASTRIVGAPPVQLVTTANFSIAGTLNVSPLGAPTVTFNSSNPAVASVSATGLVTLGSPGVASVTATVNGDNSTQIVTNAVTFTVEAPTSITFSVPNPSYLIYGTAPLNINAFASSSSLANVPIEGYSGFFYDLTNFNIGNIDANTGVFTSFDVGTDVVTATLPIPGSSAFTASTTITVEDATALQASYNALLQPFSTIYLGGSGVKVSVTATSPNVATPVSVNGLVDLTFASSDVTVAAVTPATGIVTPGTVTGVANITASYLGVDAVLPITTAAVPSKPTTLLHRYSFTGTANDPAPAATMIMDSVGTAHGEVLGTGAVFDATGTSLVLPGGLDTAGGGYVNLPNGLISGISNVDTSGLTFEFWMKVNAISTYSRMLDFGNSTTGEGTTGYQTSTIDVIASWNATGNLASEFTLSRALYGTQTFNTSSGPAIGVLSHVVLTVDPQTGIRKIYLNGAPTGGTNLALDNNLISMIDDVNNWLGRSNGGDPRLNGSFDEFRIYKGIMTASEVAANYALGPDLLPGAGQPYSAWSALYANNEPADGDFDKDGVSNGVEYFMGETNSPVFTSNPGIVGGKVTWPKGSDFVGTYTVQTSPDLGTWTDRASTVVGNTVEYTVTNDPNERFIRLKVVP